MKESNTLTRPVRRRDGAPPSRTAHFATLTELVASLQRHDRRVSAGERSALKQLTARAAHADGAPPRNLTAWLEARALLREAVREVDEAIQPVGLMVSLSDDVIADGLVAAVEIRLSRLGGGLPRALLDIEIDMEGHHRARMQDTGWPLPARLPPLGRVTVADYRAALMAFIHDVMRRRQPRRAIHCRQCGQPTLTSSPVGNGAVADAADDQEP